MTEKTEKPVHKPADKPYVPRKDRRASRYEKALKRRHAAKKKDARFYSVMFSMAGFMIAVVFGIAFMVMYGSTVDVSGMSGWTSPWALGLSKLELAGLVFVAFIGFVMWRRMQKR